MNMLCFCNTKMAIEIINQVKADIYHIIYTGDITELLLLKQNKKINIVLYNNHEVVSEEYYQNINWNDISPLSRGIIEDLSYCEVETLKQYERTRNVDYSLYDTRKNLYMNNLRYWNHIIDYNNIDVFYREDVPHLSTDNIIYHLCKIKQIPIFLSFPFYPNLGYLARGVKDHLPNIVNEMKILQEKMIKIPENDIQLNNNILKEIVDLHWNKKIPSILPVVVPISQEKKNKKRIKKFKIAFDYYQSNCIKINLNKPYILFPLHYQYEATTSPMAGVFADQLLVAEILSKIGLPIYVREHPRFSRNRSIEYYETLLKMNNINFISSDEDIYELIDNAFAIAALTGTAGWEAAMRGKPVLMFGYNFYQYIPEVYQIDSLEMCLVAIKDIESNFSPNKKNIYIFLKVLEEYLFPFICKENDQESIINTALMLNKIIKEEINL